MSILGKYDDLGIDPIVATEVMGILELSIDDLSIPQRFERFKDVARYVSKFENYPYLIKKLTIAKHVDKLNHIWEWCELNKRREEIKKELDKMTEDGEVMESLSNDPEGINKLNEMKLKIQEKSNQLIDTESEIKIYD